MKEKLLIIILAVLMMASPVSAAAMKLQVDAQTVNPGSRVVIPVKVSGAANLGGMDLIVLYNSSVLKYVKAEKGSISSNEIILANESRPGLISVSIVDSTGISGDGTLCQLSFDVTGTPGSSSPIAPAVRGAYTMDLKDISSEVSGTTITVSSGGRMVPFPTLAIIGAVLIVGYVVIKRKREERKNE
jgi:hypothetical protein